MSQPSFSLPDQLRYDHATPSSLGTNVEMAVVTPYTGSAAQVIQSGNYFIINIPKSGDNCVFDPMNSFLRYKITLTDTANTAGGINVNLCGNADCIFRRMDVYQGSNVLEQVDQYGNLSNMLMNSQVDPISRAYQWSVLKGTSSTVGTKTGQQFAIAQNSSTSYYYTTTLLSGVVGSLSRCYIPLFALNGYISFRMTLDNPLAAFYCTNAQLTGAWAGASISDIEFHASIIHCSPQTMQAISMPMYSIPTESYNTFEVNWSATNQIEQLLPFKYVSLKTIFLTMRLKDVISTNNYYQNSYGSQDISQYSFRVGSKIIPPNRVKCPNSGLAVIGQNIEAFEELKKSMHCGGNALVSMGIHNFTSYNIRSANTDTTGTFVIGQDFEQFSGKSGQIISGLDSTGSDLFFSGTWTNNTYTDANILADFYGHFDQVLVIVDGSMVGHW
jgi:hypothetical protein